MTGWRADKRWSDRFLPEIKRILGEHLISEPPVEEDMGHNTDLVVLRLDAVRIACRVRRYGYLERYGGEFTVRTGRPSGAKTELTKIVEGWGQYLFYGFADEQESKLSRWVLGDLNAFRIWLMRFLSKSQTMPGNENFNGDGSSSFRAFQVNEIPGFIVAQSVTDER